MKKRPIQVGIKSFFSKKAKAGNTSTSSLQDDKEQNLEPTVSNTNCTSTSLPSNTTSTLTSNTASVRDFGNILNEDISKFNDYERYEWLKNVWMPSADFKFPSKPEGNKNRSFQPSWLNMYPWLVYSQRYNGGLCKACILFGKNEGGRNDVKLGKLVVQPLTSFKKAVEVLKTHNNTEYHKRNMVLSQNFNLVMEGKKDNIVSSLNAAELAIIENNKKRLVPIIKTVMFCGIQNIPLRGHRDDGDLLKTTETSKEGNFRALLRFRIDAGDKDLESHIKSCSKTSSYVSKTIQNDLIECCGDIIRNKIATKVKESRFFTIIADETTDLSTKEQLSVCIRYFDESEIEISEEFLSFVDVVDLTGENIAKTILKTLAELGIDINYCRGQAYDGGANMSGKFNGVQAHIMKIQPLAMYSHCTSHRLNLVLSKACSVPAIRNAVGVISALANFFRDSAKRLNFLESAMNENLKKGKHAIKKMCETRWIERHDAILTCFTSMPFLHNVLETMANSNEGLGCGNNAFSLLQSVISTEFVVSLVILEDTMTITLPLARSLQAEHIDVLKAMTLVNATLASIKERRTNSSDNFKTLFKKAEDLAAEMGTELKKPRTTNSQRHRANHETDSVEEYFRISVYIPFLDFLISEISFRFPKDKLDPVGKLQALLPDSAKFKPDYEQCVFEGAKPYQNDLPSYDVLKGELCIWRHMWDSKETDFPKNLVEAYKLSSDLPNVRKLIQIISILPVTTCTAERSFSALKRIKSYLRSTMGEDRLNGLASLHINCKYSNNLKPEEVLDLFAKKHKRKLSLSLE